MSYFDIPKLRRLRDAAEAAGIVIPSQRVFLLAGIHPRIVNTLPYRENPTDQLYSDLLHLNDIVRLLDGTIPIVLWLDNAEDAAKPKPQAAEFAAAKKSITDQTDFRAPAPNTAALQEKNEVIIHENDMLPLWFLSKGLEAGKSVAKLLVPRFEGGAPAQTESGERVVGSGTGWLLTPKLMITNHHVINARHETEGAASNQDFADQAAAAEAQFDFDADGVEGTKYKAKALKAFDQTLDFAILQLDRIADRKGLHIAPERLVKQQNDYIPVNIIQHPNARFKKIAIRNNLVTASSASELRYFTDTDSGSSGSPVFDDQWRVVGLHRGAVPVSSVQFQGKSTAWVNYGTPIHEIFRWLQTNRQAMWDEIKQDLT